MTAVFSEFVTVPGRTGPNEVVKVSAQAAKGSSFTYGFRSSPRPYPLFHAEQPDFCGPAFCCSRFAWHEKHRGDRLLRDVQHAGTVQRGKKCRCETHNRKRTAAARIRHASAFQAGSITVACPSGPERCRVQEPEHPVVEGGKRRFRARHAAYRKQDARAAQRWTGLPFCLQLRENRQGTACRFPEGGRTFRGILPRDIRRQLLPRTATPQHAVR